MSFPVHFCIALTTGMYRKRNVIYLGPGHLPGVATPVRTCAANGLVGHQSMKKPIRVFRRRCRWFLKQFTESTSKLLLCLTSLNLCPLRCFVLDNSNIYSRGNAYQPLAILNTLIISALFRLSSKLQSPKRSSLSQYGSLENPGIIFAKLCCTLSISDLSL